MNGEGTAAQKVNGGGCASTAADRSGATSEALAHIARGHVYSEEGQLADAAACFEKALALDPDLPMAHNNLGWIRERQGDRTGALRLYRRAVNLNGAFWLAQRNLASLLTDMARTEEALPIWKALAAARPADRALLDEAITAHLNAGDISCAAALARQYALLSRGSQWIGSASEGPPAPLLSADKLRHDMEQFDYLQRRGRLPGYLADAADRYRAVWDRVSPLDENARLGLSDADLEQIGHIYNRIVYWRPAPRVAAALSRAWNPKTVEEMYLGNLLEPVVVDDFLSEEALANLREFCMESTVWFANRYGYGRLGAFFRDGFNGPLLVQIAEELQCALPRVIGKRHPLLQMWGFKYGHVQPATFAHADFAAVNVNIWLTPDSANLSSGSGGIIVYDVEAPADWDFDSYNRRGENISDFLRTQQPRAITIPYRANRAVIFNSDLFHATSPFYFRKGYENRRINVTMLFGRRDAQQSDRAM